MSDPAPHVKQASRRPRYYAMYSGARKRVVTRRRDMVLPLDDHMVHRGDGVFEVFKCVGGRLYNMEAHLLRLEHSARVLGIHPPASRKRLAELVVRTVRAGRHRDCAIHLFISRGPGSFSVNPYDCPRPGLYIAVVELRRPFMEAHPRGASVASSRIPPKTPFYAQIKSCNYLTNVFMKKEAVERRVDFVVGFDARGRMTEGPSENVGIVTRDRRLLFPRLGGILRGTTMIRIVTLARRLVRSGELRSVCFRNIRRRDVGKASEVLIVGTTLNVASGVEFDGRRVGSGKPGPVSRSLSRLLDEDIRLNRRIQTPVFH